eukprot:CAMPEP_0171698392 /NCGR_PEP_ID=MMETSP0991-20121206/9335_1 /TAXON_ID=483369 /ORGANISM="non described non described, Strain CCMP2098" /LENGTH=384 /DNA_ID=CAMNT_0012287259 /DNA_START=79 /DNA_END=1229 /DNA_ORIENTATION=+
MPVEVDRKRDQSPKPVKAADAGPEEIQNETPPYSALTHINIDNIDFVVKLCPGRHNPDQPRKKMARGADGKVVKPPRSCKNPACNLRTNMIERMMEKTVELKERMVEIAEILEGVQEERAEAELELETQKQYLQDSVARHDLLKLENKECEEELEKTKHEEYEGKSRVTEMEAERQQLARIVFENKLKQQGIEVEGWDGDGLTLNPSAVFEPTRPAWTPEKLNPTLDFAGEPKEPDFVDRTLHKPADWCTMEQLNLTEHMKVPPKSRQGVAKADAMLRPYTSPPNAARFSSTYNGWEAQANILPQPSLASSVDAESVKRFERTDRVPKPKQPSFDARVRIAEQRQENKYSRSLLSDSSSVYSWRQTPKNNGNGINGGGGRVDSP